MCLSRIDTIYDQASGLIVDGWKEFLGSKAQPVSLRFKVGISRDVPVDRWLQASDEFAPNGILADDGRTYKAGFHVYADEGRSESYRRVYLRGVTCVGKQGGRKCMIAQEMYVPSDAEGWPPQAAPKEDRGKKRAPRQAGRKP